MENHHGKSTKQMAIFLLAIYVTVPEGIATPRKKHNITLFPEIIPSLIVSTPPQKKFFFFCTGSIISMHFGDLFSGGLFHWGNGIFCAPDLQGRSCDDGLLLLGDGSDSRGVLSPKIDGYLITTCKVVPHS